LSDFTTEEYRSALSLGHNLAAALPSLAVDGRIAKLQTLLGKGGPTDSSNGAEPQVGLQSEALLVTNPANVRYLTGFTGSSGRVLVTATSATLVTDARYEERAMEELQKVSCSARIVILRTVAEQDAFLAESITAAGVLKLGLEANHVSWHDAERYRALIAEGELIAEYDAVERLRRTKEPAEVARLARASAIADAAFAQVLPRLGESISERDFASALEDAMRTYGSEEPSFSTIIAAGANASRPHHEPGSYVIQEGDEVICDFGATCEGYRSDMTRTVYISEPSMKQLRHFAVVQQAHDMGIETVTPGVSGLAVDSETRQVIIDAGWGDFFVHGTGHGSGLQIHEAPWIGPTSTSVLAAGDIVTVEPGVYLPGAGGVRIEDSMLITTDGPVLLTRSPYDLVVTSDPLLMADQGAEIGFARILATKV
jgi:Xaa-Pro aminopeptidase